MNLLRPTRPPAPQTAADYTQQAPACVACHRTGVPLQPCRLPGFGDQVRCVNPTDCLDAAGYRRTTA